MYKNKKYIVLIKNILQRVKYSGCVGGFEGYNNSTLGEDTPVYKYEAKWVFKSLGNTVATFSNWNVLAKVIAVLTKCKSISKSHWVYSKSCNTC